MQIILVSHGDFSRGALQAKEMIFGKDENMSAVGLEPEDDMESMGAKIEAVILEKNAADEDILILSDIFFGSPFNTVVLLMPQYKIRHVTGMNLSMIIEAVNRMQSGETIESITEACIKSGKEGVIDVNKYLKDES